MGFICWLFGHRPESTGRNAVLCGSRYWCSRCGWALDDPEFDAFVQKHIQVLRPAVPGAEDRPEAEQGRAEDEDKAHPGEDV